MEERINFIKDTAKNIFKKIEFTKDPEGLYTPLKYTIELGGKRLRPVLCLATYLAFKEAEVQDKEKLNLDTIWDDGIVSAAEGIEVFHSFTLIHDDIMDRSSVRRNAPTVWKKWGEDTGILSGDAMCIDAYRRIGNTPKETLKDVLDLFTKTAAEVCEGQQYDMEFEDREDVSMAEYLKMIALKTGVLIACAAEMGAIIAKADEESCRNVYDFAMHIGLAFQIADDYLDIYADKNLFGKPIGGDIINAKKSWMRIKAIEVAKKDPNISKELDAAFNMKTATKEEEEKKIAAVTAIYNKLNIGKLAKEEIQNLHSRGLAYLEKLPILPTGKKLLATFADHLLVRKK